MLPPAPSLPVGADGAPLFGKYQGFLQRANLEKLAGPLGRVIKQKTWMYASLAGPRALLAAAVIDVGWSVSAFAYLFDREARALLADVQLVGPPLLGGRVDDSPLGAAYFSMPGLLVEMKQRGDRLDLWVSAKELEMRAALDLGRAPPALVAVSPVPGGVVGCTQKTSAVPVVAGFARCKEKALDLSGAVGALDWSCGLLARETEWRWASAAGADPFGRPVGLNLTVGFNAHEDVVWVGDQIYGVGPASLEFDDPLGPWRVKTGDGKVDLVFQPEGHRAKNTNLVLAKSVYTQPIGSFTGVVRPDGDAEVRFERVPGVTEVHLARW